MWYSGIANECLVGICEAVDERGESWTAHHGQTESHDCPQDSNPRSECMQIFYNSLSLKLGLP
jgi:hypothetical protein